MICIDSLDESLYSLPVEQREKSIAALITNSAVVKMLASCPNVRLIVTSRSDIYVTRLMNAADIKISVRTIASNSIESRADVRDFISAALEEPCNKTAIEYEAKINIQAGGNFLVAAELIRAIANGLTQINKLLTAEKSSLAELYNRILQIRIPSADHSDVARILEIILASFEPISFYRLYYAGRVLLPKLTEERLAVLMEYIAHYLQATNTALRQSSFAIYHQSFADWLLLEESNSFLRCIRINGHRAIALAEIWLATDTSRFKFASPNASLNINNPMRQAFPYSSHPSGCSCLAEWPFEIICAHAIHSKIALSQWEELLTAAGLTDLKVRSASSGELRPRLFSTRESPDICLPPVIAAGVDVAGTRAYAMQDRASLPPNENGSAKVAAVVDSKHSSNKSTDASTPNFGTAARSTPRCQQMMDPGLYERLLMNADTLRLRYISNSRVHVWENDLLPFQLFDRLQTQYFRIASEHGSAIAAFHLGMTNLSDALHVSG